MARIVLFLLLLLFIVGVPWGILRSLRAAKEPEPRRPPPPDPAGLPPGWRELGERDPRFAEALQTRARILSLVTSQREASDGRYADLLSEVDRLVGRIASNLEVLAQTERHLAAFDPAQLQARGAALRTRLEASHDTDARRLIEASLHEIEEQAALRDGIVARSERLASGVEHSSLQLAAVHLDLINVLSAGAQSEAGQLATIKERIRSLAEDLNHGALEQDEFARLVLDEELAQQPHAQEVSVR